MRRGEWSLRHVSDNSSSRNLSSRSICLVYQYLKILCFMQSLYHFCCYALSLSTALMTSVATTSKSSALSFVNGRGISSSSSRVSGLTAPTFAVTTKAPFLGFSLFISTVKPWAFNAFSSFAARPLNTPQDLQCSIETTVAVVPDSDFAALGAILSVSTMRVDYAVDYF